jgi:hypothetical protein
LFSSLKTAMTMLSRSSPDTSTLLVILDPQNLKPGHRNGGRLHVPVNIGHFPRGDASEGPR